ncbi:fasciclin domain-containing protein [Gudongella sp. DL1XJH-153]|uniref:fasciclin domain-containing protein n=1 Tax=Gudongella sp. DL1XJH-153 TaxID=3409804 RepID=UPI003BB74F4E
MKKIMSIMLALMLAISIPVFAEEGTIVDIAVESEDFSILVAALQQAELVGALQGEGPFTVFAPTDAAFAKLLGELGIEAGDLLAHPQLAEVLLYHVVSGKVMSTDLSDGMMAPTLKGDNITVDLSDGVKINSSNVVTADIEASNGVIHVIDTVLVPSDFVLSAEEEVEEAPGTIVDIAVGSEDFSILVAALQQAELVGALQGEGPFTVFAPTNEAFAKLLGQLGIEAGDLLAHPQLAEVLLYHVVSGKVMSTDLSDGMMAPTLKGDNITVDLEGGVKINSSNVVTADIEASNGVIHVIDTVLVPSDFVLSAEAPAEEEPAMTALPATGSSDTSGLTLLAGLGMIAIGAFVTFRRKING